eukprot:312757-Amorphochlora_amoeboformis.AAC.1
MDKRVRSRGDSSEKGEKSNSSEKAEKTDSSEKAHSGGSAAKGGQDVIPQPLNKEKDSKAKAQKPVESVDEKDVKPLVAAVKPVEKAVTYKPKYLISSSMLKSKRTLNPSLVALQRVKRVRVKPRKGESDFRPPPQKPLQNL